MPLFAPRLTELNKNEVRRYARAEKINDSLIDEAVFNALIYAKPQGFFNIFDYNYKNASIFFENKEIFLEGNNIKKHLNLCEKVAVISVTVGEDIENKITKLSEEGKYTLSLLLDAAATEAVEKTADMLEKAVNKDARREGFNMTFRFSPGYGDFPLSTQEEILKLASGEKIGITLTSSLMLIPRKSITAIIGLKRDNNKFQKHNCNECDKMDCDFRK